MKFIFEASFKHYQNADKMHVNYLGSVTEKNIQSTSKQRFPQKWHS